MLMYFYAVVRALIILIILFILFILFNMKSHNRNIVCYFFDSIEYKNYYKDTED
jgi:hypothetical protein